jgi:hypothetical protein
LSNFRKLFTFWNRRNALDLKSIYFHAIALSLFTLKYVCLRKNSLRSTFFSFCGVHVCDPFVSYVFTSWAYAPCIQGHKYRRHKRKMTRNGESFVLRQTYFSVNNSNAVIWKYVDIVNRDGFKKWTTAWRWPSKAETCSNWCDFNVILS